MPCSTATRISGLRLADPTVFSFATRAISPTWKCCWTASSLCCWVLPSAMTIPFLTVDLTNPDIYLNQKLVQPKDMLHVVRTIFLLNGTAYQRLRLQNHGDHPFDVELSFAFASDFADLFEVRGLHRKRRGVASADVGKARGRAELSGSRRQSAAHDGSVRTGTGPPVRTARRLRFRSAAQRVPARYYVTVNCEPGAEEPHRCPFRKGLRAAFKQRPGREPRHGHDHQLESISSTRWYAARWPTLRC